MKKPTGKKKKGSLIIEFIVIVPALWFAIWAGMFIIMYVMAQNTVHQAAVEGARILTQELRGNTGKIPDTDEIKDLLANKVKNSTEHYNYVLLFHDKKNKSATPDMLIEPSGGCLSAIEGLERVICAETKMGNKAGIEQQQVIVYIKSKFHVIANIIPGMADNTFATGKGSSEKEFPGRFNYWK